MYILHILRKKDNMIELQEDKITNLVIDEQDYFLHEDIMLDEDESPSNVLGVSYTLLSLQTI